MPLEIGRCFRINLVPVLSFLASLWLPWIAVAPAFNIFPVAVVQTDLGRKYPPKWVQADV